MPYPARLVPQKTDSLILKPNTEEILCRWVDPSLELRDSEGKLTAEAVDEKRIINYSVNKLPPSETQDIYIEFFDKKKFNESWQPNTEGYMPNDDEFAYQNDRGLFYFKIKDIEYSAEYPYPVNTQPYNYRFNVRVTHVPLISNYSHFELQFEYENLQGEPAEKVPNAKAQKIIASEVRQKLIKISKFNLEHFS